MSHDTKSARLHDEREYHEALHELGDLMLSDPDTPAGRRFDELIALIEDFDERRDGDSMLSELPDGNVIALDAACRTRNR